jgi:beta-lactamase regulating signal transducer with metallopeptidase domain
MNGVDVAARYLLTYVAHSTFLTLLVWLGVRVFASRNPRLEEIALRGALLGALVTAAVPIGFALVPRTARAVPEGPVVAVEYAAVPAATSDFQIAGPAALPASPVSLPAALLLLWGAGLCGVGASFAWSYRRLRSRLRGRTDVTTTEPVGTLRRLTAESTVAAPVRLTESTRLPMPVALGTRRPEICVPSRALAELGAEQQETLLAHEVAHLERRDPAWLAVYNVVCGFFFFQPLHWIVRRRLIALSEILADQWAVEQTGRPVDLARCLSEVADWIVRDRGLLAAPGMAGYRSQLGQRIERLLTSVPSRIEITRSQRWLAAAAPLVLVAALVPAISLAEKPAEAKDAEAVDAVVMDDIEPAPEPAPAAAPKRVPRGRRVMPPPAPPAPVIAALPPHPAQPPQPPQFDRLMVLRKPGQITIRGSAAELAAVAKQLELLSDKANGLRDKVEQELERADGEPAEFDIEIDIPHQEIQELAHDAAVLAHESAEGARRLVERTIHEHMPNAEQMKQMHQEVEKHRQEFEKHHKEMLKRGFGPDGAEIQKHVREALDRARTDIQRAAGDVQRERQETAKAMAEQQKQLAEQMKQLKQQAEELRVEVERMKKEKEESR